MRKTVAVDASFLAALLDKRLWTAPVAGVIKRLSEENAKVIIPTPALAEVLTHAKEAGHAYLEQINKCSCFQVRPFDDKASIELAQLLGNRAAGIREILRFDRQIVAIAKVYGATTIYAGSEEIADFGRECGIEVKRFHDLI